MFSFFDNLKIHVKVTLLALTVTFLSLFCASYLFINNRLQLAEDEMVELRATSMSKIQEKLEGIVDIAYGMADRQIKLARDRQHLEKTYGFRLKNTVDSAVEVLVDLHKRVQAGELSEAEAQKRGLETVKAMQYDGGVGYIWINDTGDPIPKMVMHPKKPSLDGKDMDNPVFNCANDRGENLFTAAVHVCKEKGEGFVKYVWDKPTPDGKSKAPQPKLSYVKLFGPWGWILGSGIYVDDAEREALNTIKNSIRSLRFDGGLGYVWINDTSKPFPKMVMHPIKPALEGKVMDNPVFNCAGEDRQNLFNAAVEVCLEQGAGYVRYLWPKVTKDGSGKVPQPKESFVRLHPDLQWVMGTGVYIDDIDAEIAAKREALNEEIHDEIVSLLIMALVIMFLTAGLSYYLAKRLAKPLVATSEALRMMSQGEGDLTLRISVTSKDEVGEMAQWFNPFIERLQSIIATVQKRSSELNRASQSLSNISGELNESSDVLQEKTSGASVALRQINDRFANVVSATTQIGESISRSTNDADDISKKMLNIDSEIQGVQTQVKAVEANSQETHDRVSQMLTESRAASQQMEELSHSASEIGKVTELIKSISEQTNLLALNATIEAASAGDAGKGFTVVAGEIKELAAQSAKAAESITEKIEEVQGKAMGSVETFNRMNEIINDISEKMSVTLNSVKEQAASTVSIAQSSKEASAGMKNVADAFNQILKGNKDVNESIVGSGRDCEDVSQRTSETNEISISAKERSNTVSRSSEELLKMSYELYDLVSKFKV